MSHTQFRSSFDILGFERAIRMRRLENHLNFGIPFLDDSLGGIATNDLIVIGARSGAGKTELVNTIAIHNILRNRRVHYYALEAEKFEVERRAKFKLIAYLMSLEEPDLAKTLNYMDWYNGLTSASTDKYEEIINQKYAPFFKNLHTFYRESEFRIEEFEASLQQIKDSTDLIIIDHLHYFDFDDGNEASAIKSTVKKLEI